MSVLINPRDGTFNPAVTYSVGTAPGAHNTGDFNGDSKRDIAVRNVGSKSVSILINRGDGSFSPP